MTILGDYIRRTVVLEKLFYHWDDKKNYCSEQDIMEIPTADVEPVKHGEWVVGGNCNHVPHRIKNPEKWVIHKCSECGYSNGRKQSNYCPNCGAKMDGGDAG